MFPLVHSNSGVTVFFLLPQGVGLYNTYNKIQGNQTKPPEKPRESLIIDKSNHATLKSSSEPKDLETSKNASLLFGVQSVCIASHRNAI